MNTRTPRLTAKQEAFVAAQLDQQARGERLSLTAAYRVAYPACNARTAKSAAYRLNRNPLVQQALVQRARTPGVSFDYCSANYQWCVEEGKKAGDFAAVTTANTGLAKLHGYIVEKKEVTNLKDEEVNTLRRLVNERVQVN